MRISGMITPQRVLVRASAPDKAAVIRALVEALAADGQVLRDPEACLQDILDREASCSTAVGGAVAVPHAKSESVIRPAVAAMTLPEGVAWYLSGHNHHRWDVCAGGRHGVNPGSLGMLEDGHGGTAPFAIMEAEGERVSCQVCHATYDPAETRRAYVASGAAQAAPEMCRAAMYTMETGTYQACLKFVRLARELGEPRGLTLADPEAFRLAAAAWDWGAGMSCAEYWRRA